MASGTVSDDTDLTEYGLEMLTWLVDTETRDGNFSFTPVGGWAPGEPRLTFDQQPIEAAAMSDACERAWTITGEDHWKQLVLRCGDWLLGANDSHRPLYDSNTGATADGLVPGGVNANRGDESTIAGLAVLQACSRVLTGSRAGGDSRGEVQHQP